MKVTALPVFLAFALLPGCPAWAAPVLAPPATWKIPVPGSTREAGADCTAEFQQALDEAGQAGGGVVEVPAGQYHLQGALSIPANVTLQGIYRVPPTSGPAKLSSLAGSVLLACAGRGDTNAPPFIRLAGDNASIAGFIIAYPEWRQSDVPPIPFPPCIFAQGAENVGVRDCCLLNPFEGIKLVRAPRHLVRNVTGYPIWRGIYVDQCYDIGHIENVHFWPFGVHYQPENPYCKWINTHGTAFELARTDWHYVHNTFCFGYGVGYKFSPSKDGSANGNFLGLGADSCQRAVVVEQAQAPGLLISNGEFVGRWGSTNSITLEIGPEVQGKVSLVNCSFWGPIDRCVWMRSPFGQFTASACHFVEWDNGAIGSPAVQADAGRVILQACTFAQSKLHVEVGSNVISTILTGNQAEDGFRVRNLAGRRTQSALNETSLVEWTPAARQHYEIEIGRPGDGPYLEGWHGREQGKRPFRWSQGVSRLSLPVVPGEAYTLRLEFTSPSQALSPEAGLYLKNRRLAPLTGENSLTVSLPPGDADSVELELRCRGWVPRDLIAGSGDGRRLGVQGHKIEMRAAAGPERVFDANTGEWKAADRQ